MLCYKCGSHVPDTAESCPNCGQKLTGGGVRQATATFSRRKLSQSVIEGAPFKPQDLIANRYLIKDTIAVGPLGYLFRAHDKEIDVEVAMKVINPKLVQTADERKAFSKQIRLARKLSHPNLVRVYEEGEDQDRPYYTSQYLDGLTLRKISDLRLTKGQFFALREIEPILLQVANALDAAHKVGPHSDIKPENVLVLPDLLKVTDFGVGLAMPRLPFVQAMKARRADRYLAPELAEGREVDTRTDIYSLGVVLGEMLSGLTPDGAIPELLKRNPDIPPAMEGLYRKALNSNPLARFKTGAEMMAEFSQITNAVSPPPLRSRENALGPSSLPRPRTTTGMSAALQLSPRREKPPPPVPEMPPPPPDSEEAQIASAELIPPDATQPVDDDQLRSALEAKNGATLPDDGREPTEVIDSGQLLMSGEDEATNIKVDAYRDAQAHAGALPSSGADPKNRTVVWLVLLTIVGVGVGAGGGYYLLQNMRERTAEAAESQRRADDAKRLDELKKAEETRAAEVARKVEEERLAQKKKDDDEAAVKEQARLAAEQKTAEKTLMQQGLADKKDKEKVAAAEAAALQAAEAAALKEAAAQKAAQDKADREAKAAEAKAARDAEKKKNADEKGPTASDVAVKKGDGKAPAMVAAAEKKARAETACAWSPAAASRWAPRAMTR